MCDSENEDDPYVSSGEDWQVEEEKKKKRRLSTRLSKKPRISLMDMEEYSTDDDEVPEAKPKRTNGKQKFNPNKKVATAANLKPVVIINTDNTASSTSLIEYTSGAFVISKRDAEQFDTKNPPNIWRIDGKALLQKYEAFHEENQIKFKNTSIYTGWSSSENCNYMLINNVKLNQNTPQSITVTFDANQFNEIKDFIILDSD